MVVEMKRHLLCNQTRLSKFRVYNVSEVTTPPLRYPHDYLGAFPDPTGPTQVTPPSVVPGVPGITRENEVRLLDLPL